jgi:hypothetical protein
MVDKTVADLVTGGNAANGVYNELMKAVTADLDTQWTSGRINGPEYAKVYLGAMQAVLSQSVAYVLGENQANEQAKLTAAQTALTTQQELSEVENTLLITEQKKKVTAEELLTDAKTATESSQQSKLAAETTLLGSQNTTETNVRAKIDAEASAATANAGLADAKVTTETNVRSKLTAEASAANASASLSNAKVTTETNVRTKLTAEADLLDEKQTSESKQTVTPTAGVLKAQYDLYQKQTDGYDRDAEQKFLKLAIDMHSIMVSSGISTAAPKGLDETDIGKIVTKVANETGVVGITY